MDASAAKINVELLREHLVEVSAHEGELTVQVYESLFAKRPDAEELAATWRAALDRINEMMTAGYVPSTH